MSIEKHPLHLKDSELQKSEEVSHAVEKEERLEDENIPNDPSPRIEAYMDRLENIFLNPDERIRERNLDMFRDKIYDELLVKRENFPESYFELQQRIARERGQPVEEVPQNVREQMIDTAIEDQKHSLDAWMEYLTEEDVAYPTWFKFYVWNQVIRLSQFDKVLSKFKSRTESTVARFPDINRAALAKILDIYEKVETDNQNLKDPEIRENFFKRFSTLYAEFIAGSLASKIENKEEIRGQWIKYEANNSSDADKLWHSVEGKTGGAGWCIEGKATAHSYNKQGDFYVYYTHDKDGDPTQPRLAIQMTGNQIGQIRGLLPHQDVEPIFQEVLDEKLKDFGGEADSYKKKSEDMKHLTLIWKKQFETKEPFTKEDLIFLYEIDSQIESFGYERDERIESLLRRRNQEEDMLTIFDCTKEQIAHTSEEVTEKTKVYLGEWNTTIYNKIKNFPNITHLYESFPDKKIFTFELHTDPKLDSPQKAQEEIESKGIYVSDYAKDLLSKTEFSHENKTYNLVQFTVEQLGFPQGATTDEIYQKAQELGLELCPAEVGPHLRLQYSGEDWKFIAMKQITGRGVNPLVFLLDADGSVLELRGHSAGPSDRWSRSFEFVFLSRKDT